MHLSTLRVMFCSTIRYSIKINLAAVKRTILIVLTLVSCTLVFAQNVEPAVFSHILKAYSNNVKAGEEITVIFTAKIPEGSLMYATGYTDCPPIPAKVNIDSSDAYTLSSTLISIDPETYTDDIFECDVAIFKESATFEQKIKILNKTENVSGVLEYQICSKDGYCVLFKYPFDIPLTYNP